jgi:uncharacterized membrane protein SpoIIM required for sporulation
LLTTIEKRGIRALSAQEVSDLPQLYRTALSSLSLARSISLDRNLVEYLENLATRGYFGVYGPARRFREAVADFFVLGLPSAVRALRWHVAVAAAILVAGTLVGWILVARDSEMFFSFVPEGLASGRDPTASTEYLRDTLYDRGSGREAAFSTYLFTHNASVGILCFTIGFAAGIPVFLLLFYNGVILGAFFALFASRGLGLELFAWIMPHGVTELLAVVLCGAGGLVLAQKLVLPGARRRLDNLAEGGRQAGVLATGALTMLVVAALFEGIFRQEVTNVSVRLAVAGFSAVWWFGYFVLVGRTRTTS